jgi:ATP-dependent protease Clp ATPase subunit
MVCRRSVPNVLLLGPPGAGKAMLARRLTTILPAMTLAEALEATCIHRVAGLTGERTAWVTTRPCRAPHHPIGTVDSEALPVDGVLGLGSLNADAAHASGAAMTRARAMP